MRLEIERRFSPRITTNSFIRLFPGDMQCNVLNISETGICFEYEGEVLSGDISLSMDLSPFKFEQITEISARVVWRTILSKNGFQFGAQFSSLDRSHLTQIRDFIFYSFAKKASAAIKENEDLRTIVENFFIADVKQYFANLSTLDRDVREGKLDMRTVESRLNAITDEILLKGNALEESIDNKRYMKTIKEVFREITGCLIYKGPISHMAYSKPRGYPGDFELFEIIYNNKLLSEGKNIGSCIDSSFLKSHYTMAVRTRKNKMKNILQDIIENTDLTTVKLLNIACGPCREIRELLSDPYLASKKNLIFTGLDNDKEALKFSRSKLNNLPANIQVRLLNENVLNIFRDSKYYDIIGKQDIIYILGLTEYLPDRIFKKLTGFLFQLLNDKGMLVITYKDEDVVFPSLRPDWFCDWAFIKRGKDDLVNAAKELGSDKYSIKIEREGTGYIYFLILTKK